MIKLIAFDMDGVIFKHNNFWLELHKKLGTYEQGKKLTEKYLYDDYRQLVSEVVEKLWKGMDAAPFYELISEMQFTAGAKECFADLKEKGIKTAIISSGEKHLALFAQKELGIDYVFSNELMIKKNKITGDFLWPIGADNKDVFLKRLCEDLKIPIEETCVVGHDQADIKMARAAGWSIGFMPDDKFRKVCDETIDKEDLWLVVKIIEEMKNNSNRL
ncbi:MAG: HAD family phosphatase [Nanoarchaeota archaeon]|nr:HAD family phosphatase [Nanoarchaeota archaeon]